MYLTRHVEAVHCRCACGWIGVQANHGRHVGQVRRRWSDPEHRHLVAEVLEPPEDDPPAPAEPSLAPTEAVDSDFLVNFFQKEVDGRGRLV